MSVSKGQPMRPAEVALLEICDKFANPPYFDKSGEVVVTDDAASVPLLSLTVHGKSVQDGTPTPDNPVPVQAVGGRNLAKNTDNMTPGASKTVVIYDAATMPALPIGNLWFSLFANGLVYESGSAGFVKFTRSAVNYWLPGSFGMQPNTSNNGTFTNNFTNTADDPVVKIEVIISSTNYAKFTAGTCNMQIEAGHATPYTPYGCIGLQTGETVTPIDLQGYELAGLPDGTGDVLNVYRDEREELVKRTQIVVFDGTQQFGSHGDVYNGATGTDRYINVSNTGNPGTIASRTNVINNRFVVTSAEIWSNPDRNIGKCLQNGAQHHMVFDNATLGITADMGNAERDQLIYAWLAQNPVTVLLPTTQVQTYQLPTITPPTPIDGGTVRVVANVTPEIDVRYVAKGIKGNILTLQNCADDLESMDERVTRLEQEI